MFFGCCASAVTATASNAPANRIDARTVFLNGRLIWTLFIMLDGSKERVIYEHHFSVAVSECPSIVSDENTGRHTCPYRGDGGEGFTLRAAFFAHKNKKATLSLGAFWFSSRTKADDNSLILPGIASLFDHLIRPRKQVRWNCETDLPCGFEIDDQLELRRLLNRQIGGLGSLQGFVHV